MPREHDRRREKPMLVAHDRGVIVGAAQTREGVEAVGEEGVRNFLPLPPGERAG